MGRFKIWFVVILLLGSGCAYPPKVVHEEPHTVYVPRGEEASPVGRFAPVFLTYNWRKAYNRIGRPLARYDEEGREQVYIDYHEPVIYHTTRTFTTGNGIYTNLIYRVHFPKVPFSLIPFHLTAGKNVGILVVITLGEARNPLLITTVGTCGCYAVIVPTCYLPADAYPEGWKNEPLKKYGETLPPLLDYGHLDMPRLLVHLRSGVHRIMDLEVVEGESVGDPSRFVTIEAPLVPVEDLEKIPMNGKTTSLYYTAGPARGHVKDSLKPFETLFLGLISLDFFVGTDKVYGNREVTGNPFYTSLKPWKRKASDMGDFAGFLRYWGWRL